MRTTIPTPQEIQEAMEDMRRELAPLSAYRAQILTYAVPRYIVTLASWELVQLPFDKATEERLTWIAEQEINIVEKYKKRFE